MNIFDLFIIQPIFNLLVALYSFIPGGDFGVSLIVFTILVRFALYPLVKKQLHQTKAMKKLQPELAKIKAETKGNRQLESTRMMDLYKQHGVNPFRSILILLVQLPIFFALYRVIQIFTSERDQVAKFTYDFLESIQSIGQLAARPEALNESLLGIVDLTKTAFSNNSFDIPIVIIALIAVATQYVMTRQLMPQSSSQKGFRQIMSEAAEGKQADQSEMNALIAGKMSKIFPFIMLPIMLTLPGALVLYYAVSNLVAVAQQSYILNQDEDELEDLADVAKAKPVEAGIVANKPQKTKVNKTNNVTRITAKDTRKIRKK